MTSSRPGDPRGSDYEDICANAALSVARSAAATVGDQHVSVGTTVERRRTGLLHRTTATTVLLGVASTDATVTAQVAEQITHELGAEWTCNGVGANARPYSALLDALDLGTYRRSRISVHRWRPGARIRINDTTWHALAVRCQPPDPAKVAVRNAARLRPPRDTTATS